MPKGWEKLSPLAKAGYVDADFIERVDDAMSEASAEIMVRNEELKNPTPEERSRKRMEIMMQYYGKDARSKIQENEIGI